MGYLILPVLIMFTVAPTPEMSARRLGDFSRFAKAINQRIAVVDADGVVREGVLSAADGDQITVRFGTATRTFPRDRVASAERLRDGRIDGVIKGAFLGLVIAAFGSQGLQSSDDASAYVGKTVLSFGAIGYLFDAAESNRQPLYHSGRRPPSAAIAKPSLSLSFRF